MAALLTAQVVQHERAHREQGEQEREGLLADLHQRVRDVRQGPDGLIYVLTEELDGALLVIEPAN